MEAPRTGRDDLRGRLGRSASRTRAASFEGGAASWVGRPSRRRAIAPPDRGSPRAPGWGVPADVLAPAVPVHEDDLGRSRPFVDLAGQCQGRQSPAYATGM